MVLSASTLPWTLPGVFSDFILSHQPCLSKSRFLLRDRSLETLAQAKWNSHGSSALVGCPILPVSLLGFRQGFQSPSPVALPHGGQREGRSVPSHLPSLTLSLLVEVTTLNDVMEPLSITVPVAQWKQNSA